MCKLEFMYVKGQIQDKNMYNNYIHKPKTLKKTPFYVHDWITTKTWIYVRTWPNSILKMYKNYVHKPKATKKHLIMYMTESHQKLRFMYVHEQIQNWLCTWPNSTPNIPLQHWICTKIMYKLEIYVQIYVRTKPNSRFNVYNNLCTKLDHVRT